MFIICAIKDNTVTSQHRNKVPKTEHSIAINIFDVIDENPVKAIELQALSDLMILVRDVIKVRHWSTAEAAKNMGVTPTYIRNIMRGYIDKLSTKKLVHCLYQCSYRFSSVSLTV